MDRKDLQWGNTLAVAMGGTVSGSCIVDLENAKDIDIFVSESKLNLFTTRNFNSTYMYEFTYADVTFTDSWDDRSEYYRSNNTDDALDRTYRSSDGKFNLIVVRDAFELAFTISRNIMAQHKKQFKDRQARIDLHHGLREQIRYMLSDKYAHNWKPPQPTKEDIKFSPMGWPLQGA